MNERICKKMRKICKYGFGKNNKEFIVFLKKNTKSRVT